MAKDPKRPRLSKSILDVDISTIIAVQSLPGYTPRNPTVSAPALMERLQQHSQAKQAADHTRRADQAAQAFETESGWDIHDAAVLARQEVALQYGDDSFEVEAVGRIRRSERKRPARRARSTAAKA